MKHFTPPEEPREFQFTFLGDCHKCGCSAEMDEIRRSWLTPVFVRQGPREFLQTQTCPKCSRWSLRYWIKVLLQVRIGRVSHLLAPGFGDCGRCHTNWHFCEGHSTKYTETHGCFPLCEACWSELTPERRLPYYRDLFEQWMRDDPADDETKHRWPLIEVAVLSGK